MWRATGGWAEREGGEAGDSDAARDGDPQQWWSAWGSAGWGSATARWRPRRRSSRGRSAAGSAACSGAPQQQTSAWSERFSSGQFLHVGWPVSIRGYPAKGLPGSWEEQRQMATDLGCRVTLRSLATAKRWWRPNLLTIKGPAVYDVFKLLYEATRLSRCCSMNKAWECNECIAPRARGSIN